MRKCGMVLRCGIKTVVLTTAVALAILVLAVVLYSHVAWRFPNRRVCAEVRFTFHEAMLVNDTLLAKSVAKPQLSRSIESWSERTHANSCQLFGVTRWTADDGKSYWYCHNPKYQSYFDIATQVDPDGVCKVSAWRDLGSQSIR